MNSTMMAYWYRKIAAFTRIIDRYNHSNDPAIATANDAIRRIVAAMFDEPEDTREMEAIDAGEGQS